MTARSEVVRLGPGDLDKVRATNRLFAEVFEDADTYLSAEPEDDYLLGLLSDPTAYLLACIDSGRVVGALSAYQLRKFERARSELYIYDLAVATDRRREGIATALIRAIRRLGAEAGAWVIFVQADYGDEPAIALYEKLGTREKVLHFDIAPC